MQDLVLGLLQAPPLLAKFEASPAARAHLVSTIFLLMKLSDRTVHHDILSYITHAFMHEGSATVVACQHQHM